MKLITEFVFFTLFTTQAQVLPLERSVDWSVAGIRDTTTVGFTVLDAIAEGLFNDGLTPCDYPLGSLMINHQEPIIIYFPPGEYLFNATIPLRSNMVLRGSGASNTKFIIDNNGTGNGINIHGWSSSNDTTKILNNIVKNDSVLHVLNTNMLQVGDWVQLIQDDADLVTSSWALKSVGQIARIAAIHQQMIQLDASIRIDFPSVRNPYIKKIIPVSNVGIECISFERIDNCAPEQASTIHFDYAVNCWVTGIESNKTTFAHIEGSHSSNLAVTHSYFHHAFEYGGGGRAYGVMWHFTTNECLVYGNSFEHLRHSMIVQAGANGNVFAYNRSVDPFWSQGLFFPSNSAGDMVLHGNYPFANLFEQNDGQNIVIDNSHGANGPYNTFFRNRGSLFGIFFSDNTSPSQNFIGNEIPNTGTPYSLVNYTIQGSDQFLHGNNNKGAITPAGTNNLTDSSYFFTNQPISIPSGYYASIGTPNAMNSGSIPATYYHATSNYFAESCGYNSDLSIDVSKKEKFVVYPNPAHLGKELIIDGNWQQLYWMDISGRVLEENVNTQPLIVPNLAPGVYHLLILAESVWRNEVVVVE
jgi:hypothetical protein